MNFTRNVTQVDFRGKCPLDKYGEESYQPRYSCETFREHLERGYRGMLYRGRKLTVQDLNTSIWNIEWA